MNILGKCLETLVCFRVNLRTREILETYNFLSKVVGTLFINLFIPSSLEPLFFQYGVDIIIEAHEHSYERLWPVFNDTVTAHNYSNPKAPVHLISGAAGCNEFYGICVNPMLGPRGMNFLHRKCHLINMHKTGSVCTEESRVGVSLPTFLPNFFISGHTILIIRESKIPT